MFSVSRSLICIVHGVSVVDRPEFVATKAYDLVALKSIAYPGSTHSGNIKLLLNDFVTAHILL